ncbi:uncharacterized protein LOC115098789 isoform X2 [Rhinatrema bivittatum]|uniref:uncharacterized protein LOC115098789 isoform X2 n=1 Tax=Rhinatrema bivittatum TaxID=194408 RepID=UPI00112B20F5|nr:uncharacterized protein LOC115098789 isoform X2 [Rhinatrema bivittatum]
MPEKKKKKQKVKPNPFLDVSILKKFLQTYERHCDEFQSSVSPTIKKGLWSCINNEVAITKFVLSSPETIPEDFPPVLFKPLVKTIRDMRYMLGKELCIWGILLSNLDTASLAIMLELNGRTIYPFCKLEMIDCDIDVWSMERLGKALRFSNLVSIVLDYNEFGDEGVKGLLHGLEGNKKLLSLSLCYCNLGAESGSALGPVVAQTAIQELYLNGNYLQCSGALELITPISMHTQYLAAERQTVLETSTDFAHQILEATESAGIHTAVSNLDVLPTTPQSAIPEDTNKDKKKRKEAGQSVQSIEDKKGWTWRREGERPVPVAIPGVRRSLRPQRGYSWCFSLDVREGSLRGLKITPPAARSCCQCVAKAARAKGAHDYVSTCFNSSPT